VKKRARSFRTFALFARLDAGFGPDGGIVGQ
jgi:hypothetical protein